MTNLSGWLFLIIAVTEYGVVPKARLAGRLRRWSWRREAGRGLLWAAACLSLSRSAGSWEWWAGWVAAWLVTAAVAGGMRALAEKGWELAAHLVPVAAAAAAVAGGHLVPELPFAAAAVALPVARAAGLVAMVTWGTAVTVAVVELARPEADAEMEAGDEGRRYSSAELIGILERLFIFMLVSNAAWTAVGLVIAAKSAARFPEFKTKAFAEYFLIGTLTSVGLAVAAGLFAGGSG